MKIWRSCLWAVGGAVLLVALLAVWGALLPLFNMGSRSIDIARPPATVWAVLTDEEKGPTMATDVGASEALNPRFMR